ncbi:hypothetical protein [Actinokineospora terrae]|uniref:Mce-associated membrane protein n=1 Tax=Actinokineospora terrae TaxID=155974 RepID=A0A1H9RWY5_9PSEU|nr:hypothetical protein [Actinokineospora terrae]SER77154.1 Mce-associated membrane protein [Actinokineospora terrae]
MPTPPRRRTPATGPARRPRVAGLRKPTAPAPTEDDHQLPGATPDSGDHGVAVAPEPATGPESADLPPAQPRRQGVPAETDDADGADEEPPENVLGQPLDIAAPARAVPAPIDPDPADHREQLVADGVIGADEPVHPTGKPRPTGKPTSTGTPVPDALPVFEAPGPARSRLGGTALLLLLLAVLFAGAGLFFKGKYDSLTAGVDSGNTALVDAATTSEVTGRLTVAVERTLSYSYTDLDANAKAVQETLAGTATCEYDKLFGQVRKLAPEQKLVLTTKVRKIGVTRLDRDRADLLVFVDQSTTRADQAQTTASGAVFGVRAEKLGGAWKITDFDMLDQALPGGQSTAGC